MDKVVFGSETDGCSDALPSTPSPADSVAASISMKLPAFWSDAPKVWFAQDDTQFAINHITVSKTKF